MSLSQEPPAHLRSCHFTTSVPLPILISCHRLNPPHLPSPLHFQAEIQRFMRHVPLPSPRMLPRDSSLPVKPHAGAHDSTASAAASAAASSSADSASLNSLRQLCKQHNAPSSAPAHKPAPAVASAAVSTAVATTASAAAPSPVAPSTSSSKKTKSSSSAVSVAKPKPPPFYASQDEFLLLPNSRCAVLPCSPL
jgi:hypothetical protein